MDESLFALEAERLVVESDSPVGQVVYELLQRVVIEVVGRRDADDIALPTPNVLDADQDVRLDGLRPHELLASIHRKTFPACAVPIVEPLLHIKDGATYKYAIDVVGKMKGASGDASDAVEAAWQRSWDHGVPQACKGAFRALLKIGDNDERLLAMISRALTVDNYGIHKGS